MLRSFYSVILLSLFFAASAQENKIIRINPLKENEEELTRQVYKYSDFQEGTVLFKDSATAQAKLNYHRLLGQILFINPKGDTLALAHPETFAFVAIGKDTFFYHEKSFVERLTSASSVNLCKNQTLKYIGQEKKGAYDSYSTTSSSESDNLYSTDGKVPAKLAIDQNSVFKYNNAFFLQDRFGNIFPANKKIFFDLFSHREKELKGYLNNNHVNFNREKDLLGLMDFLASLK
jgi:hypothetical protein